VGIIQVMIQTPSIRKNSFMVSSEANSKSRLTTEQLNFFEKNGYLVMPAYL
jgi:hypothetical protein